MLPPGMSTTHMIHSYGYLAVFVFVAIESLGVPIPGESALIAAGAYAGETHKLNPWLIFLVAAVAAVAGNAAGYSIGRKGGFRLALRYGSKIHLDQHKLKVGRYVLDRQGSKVVFFGRFVSVLRTYVAFLAGTLEMRWQKFAVAYGGRRRGLGGHLHGLGVLCRRHYKAAFWDCGPSAGCSGTSGRSGFPVRCAPSGEEARRQG